MMGLSDLERISMIRSAVLIQYTRVTDGRTELAWPLRAIGLYSIYAVARKKINESIPAISSSILKVDVLLFGPSDAGRPSHQLFEGVFI